MRPDPYRVALGPSEEFARQRGTNSLAAVPGMNDELPGDLAAFGGIRLVEVGVAGDLPVGGGQHVAAVAGVAVPDPEQAVLGERVNPVGVGGGLDEPEHGVGLTGPQRPGRELGRGGHRSAGTERARGADGVAVAG